MSEISLFDKIQDSSEFIRSHIDEIPNFAIQFGSGFQKMLNEIEIIQSFHFTEIPNFVPSTLSFHDPRLIIGKLHGIKLFILAGRFHHYEGYDMKQITFPIRVIKDLGIENLIITNASGGLNPDYDPGEIVLVKDHINFMPNNPLRGLQDERLGPRFPEMLHAYNEDFRSELKRLAASLSIPIKEGVYLALQGPNLETPAEYKMFHQWGADILGMSTVPEVIVANQIDLKIAVLSVVSNIGYPVEKREASSIGDILNCVEQKLPLLCKLIGNFIS